MQGRNNNEQKDIPPGTPATKPKLYTRTFEELFNDDIQHAAESSPIADATPFTSGATKFLEIVLERLDTIKMPGIAKDEIKNTPIQKDETPTKQNAEAVLPTTPNPASPIPPSIDTLDTRQQPARPTITANLDLADFETHQQPARPAITQNLGLSDLETSQQPAQPATTKRPDLSNFETPSSTYANAARSAKITRDLATLDTQRAPTVSRDLANNETPIPPAASPTPDTSPKPAGLSRGRALVFIVLLCILLFSSINLGATEFFGPHGWASQLYDTSNNSQLLQNLSHQLHQNNTAASATQTTHITPDEYIDLIMQQMTLDMKLGQMMLIQFTGPSYSPDLDAMISQYNVGTVLIFYANGNIVSKSQLKALTHQIQSSSTIPMAIAIDQEGGSVNRLLALNGPRPSAASIGATNDPAKARNAGVQDAQDLSNYGINLNLAPVVDVDNSSNSELHVDGRAYGSTPTQIIAMASAYLQGLQQSGKVIGTLKHFPGLGSVTTDPHFGMPLLSRSKNDLEQIDWAPYRALIRQGNVHAVMVTHEIVSAIDNTQPSTLSPKVVTGILRNDLGFQGVIMTDSLTMKGVTNYVSESQAAALAIEAGADLLMGASSPATVASMINGIKQAINTGAISQQQIDASVRRILMMKYAMGLLPLPKN
jgi:beta-N-acetylhexosaminidase